MNPDPLNLAFIDAYISVFVDAWGCRLDHDDGSTATFSSLAAAEADGLQTECAICLAVLTE